MILFICMLLYPPRRLLILCILCTESCVFPGSAAYLCAFAEFKHSTYNVSLQDILSIAVPLENCI